MAETFSQDALALCSDTGMQVYAERSTSGQSRRMILGAVWSVAAAASLTAVNNRVWPVAVFLMAVPAGLSLAFSVNAKDARAYETLRFGEKNFEILRYDRDGALTEHITLNGGQTRFFSEDSKIFARGPGPDGTRKIYPIAAFLSPGEKEELLKLLKEALSFQSLPDHLQKEIRAAHAAPGPELN